MHKSLETAVSLPFQNRSFETAKDTQVNMKRGALIVLEGVDRTGKSTQAKKLVDSLKKRNIQAEYTNFPARETEIGKVINNYLSSKNNLSDEAIHLLFSANRWEKAQSIINTLNAGTTLIMDRYCFSGAAFSASKGLDLNWCKIPDSGLPKPDKVFYFTMPFDELAQRNGFGQERYEVSNFLETVSKTYTDLRDETWDIVQANRTIDVIQEELVEKTLKVINNTTDKPIGKLWKE